jgi:ribonuclease D
MVAFDTEFIRESTFFPQIEILQVATRQESWLVDARAFKKKGGNFEDLRPLLAVFEDRSILKVLHAAQGDQECLFTSFGVIASPSVDTAIAASLCGYGDGIGLGNLLKSVLGVSIGKGHARTNWSVRPLPPQLSEYAHADVAHLVEAAEVLLERLEGLGRREWAIEQSARWENRALYLPDPEGVARKLARGGKLDRLGQAALQGLARWREERVRELNLPRRWVADDHVLVDLARVRPRDLEHLSAFRGLNKGEIKNSGERILAAIRASDELAAAASRDPKPRREPPPELPTREEQRVLDLLQCYVGILADRHQLAPKHLLVSAELLPLLRSRASTPEELVSAGLLSSSAAKLVGAELLAFLRGEVVLGVDAGKPDRDRLETESSARLRVRVESR